MSRVNFWFVRHGFSCGNRSSMLGHAHDQRIMDPGLTDYGADTSGSIAHAVPEEVTIDFLFSSCLSRAIQTAYLMFVRNARYRGPIVAAPFLREIGLSPENMPHPNQAGERLGSVLDRQVVRVAAAYDHARDRLGGIRHFMTWFLSNHKHHVSRNRVTNVVVVTHGGRMREDLRLDHWPLNNETVFVSLDRGVMGVPPVVVYRGVSPPRRLDLDRCRFR
jgi:broad specificity phosphatase PhoE